MVATVKVYRYTGASAATGTDITSINTRANSYDGHSTADTTYPIQIPAAGSNYSYWVSTRLNCTSLPSGTINNLRWYTDGSNGLGTGVTMKAAKASTGADSGYRQATGTPGTTGTELSTGNHSGLDATPADAFTFTSASPLSLTGSVSSGGATGAFGDYVVYQIIVASTASPGATSTETLTYKFDET